LVASDAMRRAQAHPEAQKVEKNLDFFCFVFVRTKFGCLLTLVFVHITS